LTCADNLSIGNDDGRSGSHQHVAVVVVVGGVGLKGQQSVHMLACFPSRTLNAFSSSIIGLHCPDKRGKISRVKTKTNDRRLRKQRGLFDFFYVPLKSETSKQKSRILFFLIFWEILVPVRPRTCPPHIQPSMMLPLTTHAPRMHFFWQPVSVEA
jgi:hypothetical protein